MKRFILLIFMTAVLSGCHRAPEPEVPEITAGEDEFLIAVNLDTADNVYILGHEYALDGVPVGGGDCMNAGMKPLEGYVYMSFQRDVLLEKGEDTDGFSVMFFVGDTPVIPQDIDRAASHNGEYAVENEIRFSPRYGEIYSVTVSGSSKDGYKAALTSLSEEDQK